ncbi:MAG: VCBS repeat-containing protein, partial [Flavobacteriales bacterium]|nr:VCBS repeat-containing protein [Flavobacteriales bacterium]
MSRIHLSLFIASAFIACSEQDNTPFEAPITAKASEGLFVARSAKDTGIDFVNSVPENNEQNYYIYEYFYNGGGVAVGDVNNDGLPDIYFTSNLTQDKLYLNEGGLRFKDVTMSSLPK